MQESYTLNTNKYFFFPDYNLKLRQNRESINLIRITSVINLFVLPQNNRIQLTHYADRQFFANTFIMYVSTQVPK